MLSEVLRRESPAVDARPALSTSDSTWLDRPRTDAAWHGGLRRALEFVPRHLHTIPPATGPDRLPGGAVIRRLGPLGPPDPCPAGGETPPGHRQTHHPPDCLLPAACRVSASCRAFPSPYRRWRTTTRDDAGTHE